MEVRRESVADWNRVIYMSEAVDFGADYYGFVHVTYCPAYRVAPISVLWTQERLLLRILGIVVVTL